MSHRPWTGDVCLRPVQPSDAEFLYRVYTSTRQPEMDLLPWSEAEKDAFLRMQFEAQTRDWSANNPRASFQVVIVHGQPAGRLYVDRREDEIRVVDVALLPEFRGRGIGGALLAGVLREADGAGKPVRIHVERFNPAQRLYERLGFRVLRDGGVYLLLERRPRIAGTGPFVTERPEITALHPLVGQTFGMRIGPERWMEVQLVEVKDLGRRRSEGRELSCFSLLFRSGSRDHVPQAIYTLRHPALGPLDVFLVPIGPDEVGMRYEAIFS